MICTGWTFPISSSEGNVRATVINIGIIDLLAIKSVIAVIHDRAIAPVVAVETVSRITMLQGILIVVIRICSHSLCLWQLCIDLIMRLGRTSTYFGDIDVATLIRAVYVAIVIHVLLVVNLHS